MTPTATDSEEISLLELPIVDPKGYFDKAGLDIREALASQATALLNVPVGTEIFIEQSDSGLFPKVVFQHTSFRVRIRTTSHHSTNYGRSRVVEGPPADQPWMVRVEDLDKIPDGHIMSTIALETSFNLIEEGVEARDEYRRFVGSLRNYLCREWDALDFIRRHRGTEPIMRIEAKLDQLRKDVARSSESTES